MPSSFQPRHAWFKDSILCWVLHGNLPFVKSQRTISGRPRDHVGVMQLDCAYCRCFAVPCKVATLIGEADRVSNPISFTTEPPSTCPLSSSTKHVFASARRRTNDVQSHMRLFNSARTINYASYRPAFLYSLFFALQLFSATRHGVLCAWCAWWRVDGDRHKYNHNPLSSISLSFFQRDLSSLELTIKFFCFILFFVFYSLSPSTR